MSRPRGALALPERANLEQLRKQAKDAHTRGEHPTLAAAQLALARTYGYSSWTTLKRGVELATLYRLITEGEVEPVRAVLARSPALVRARFDDGDTPLLLAVGENRPDLVELLVRLGASTNTRLGASAHSALSWAATTGSFAAAERLIALGAAPDLFAAAGLGLVDLVRGFWRDGRLLAHPSTTGSSRFDASGSRLPCPPARDEDAVSDALYIACRNGQLEASRWLLDRGADPNWRGFAGATCLAWAEFSDNAPLSALLRERGGRDDLLDPRYRAEPRVFAIMVLAGWGFGRRLAERLARDPAAANMRGARGTVLHAAAEAGQRGSVAALLNAGADPRARDAAGRTPSEVARAAGFAELAVTLGG